MIDKMLRVLISALSAWGGYQLFLRGVPILSELLGRPFFNGINFWPLVGAVLGGVVGLLISSWLINRFWQFTFWIEFRLNRIPMSDIISGALGLTIGLIIANLIGTAFSHVPIIGNVLPIVLSMILGYLGMNLAVKKREELIGFFAALPWVGGKEKGKERSFSNSNMYPYKILDTSVIIDGRIADICKSGFLEGTLIIPVFVLEELQHIADSSDLLKRNRGRRGLDILNRIQKELQMYVQIDNRDFDDINEVDSKLVRLGQMMKAKIVTNDYNLNKVAELQGVPVLNINELSNAVKPVVLPGEDMVVHVIKDGKEFGQGVAYLDDGTMIVVDGGKKHIGETIGVMVTSVLQTAAGRMIFAKPKALEKAL
jgi:uncharacterized protein YacL